MRAGRLRFPNHPLDLGDLFHQMQLSRQSARSVCQHHVDAAGLGCVDGIENDRGWVTGFLGDNHHAVFLAPGLQLLTRGGTEGVAGGEQHRFSLGLEVAGQLADRGGLAGAVDPGDHDDEGFVRRHIERLLQRRQQILERLHQGHLELSRRLQFVAADSHLQFVEQESSRVDAHVGLQQGRFQLFEQVAVYPGAPE